MPFDRSLAGLRQLTAALWFGLVLTLATVAAPTLFAMLDRVTAGQLAGRMFQIEAYAGLALGIVLLLLERRQAARRPLVTAVSRLSTNLMLVLMALFCTVFGYFALQPLMAAAKAGQAGAWSFGQLHAASTVFFVAKGAVLAALVWRRH